MMLNFFQKERYRFLAPFLFLAACVIAFGVQIPWLGFYLDDWVILNAYNMGGAERVFEYAFQDNRPLVAWIWIVTFQIFGTQPVVLQIWSLFWRLMSVIVLWLGWREVWPKAGRQVTMAALLFAVYPLFRQQPSSLAFLFQWVCLFLFGMSLYAMLRAIRQPKYFLPWMSLSVLSGVVSLFSQEYFVGLELLRPVMLWLVLRHTALDRRERLKRVLLAWLPFVLMMAGYLVWRFALMPTTGVDRNTPELVFGLFTSPISTLPRWITMVLQDMVESLAGVWYTAIHPSLFIFAPLANIVAWAAAVVLFLLAYLYFRGRSSRFVPEMESPEPWYRSAVPFGILAMLLGFAPSWAIGRQLFNQTGMFNDRFGLAATIGAAILLVALVEFLLKKESHALIVLCVLIGLGAGQNFRFVTNYRYSWEKQRQFYWQLKWRAPALQPGTAVIGDGALISYMGSWVTISSLLQLYTPTKDAHTVDYWYFDANDLTSDQFEVDETPFIDEKKYMRFAGQAGNNLVIDFEPEKLRCLWVLSENDEGSRILSQPLKELLPYSNPDRILAEPDLPPRVDIFGEAIPRDWCYYFQKGDLARQYQDWETVVQLWREAEQNDKHPRNGVEYRPFIQGFAHTGDWQTAIEFTRQASFPKYEMRELLCDAWRDIAVSTTGSPERDQALATVTEDFECQDELGDLLAQP